MAKLTVDAIRGIVIQIPELFCGPERGMSAVVAALPEVVDIVDLGVQLAGQTKVARPRDEVRPVVLQRHRVRLERVGDALGTR